MLCYITSYDYFTTFFFFFFSQFNGSNGKVKLERSGPSQLGNSWRKARERG